MQILYNKSKILSAFIYYKCPQSESMNYLQTEIKILKNLINSTKSF